MSESTNTTQEQTFILDGAQVSAQQLNEARNKPGVKIKEEAPGVFKTLQRLNGWKTII